MYYNIVKSFTFAVMPTRCSINMLLKVNHCDGFLNWSNDDELMINSTSGCNCNSYKLNKLQT